MNELQSIQANLNAPKNQRNDFGKFNYRSCEDILQAVKPLLEELECILTLTDRVEVIGKSMQGVSVPNKKADEPDTVDFNNRFYFVATATLRSKDGAIWSVDGWAREPTSRKGMDSSQLSGAASSYARKYALSGLFLLDDNKDADSVLNVSEAEIDAFSDLIEEGTGEAAAKLLIMQTNDVDKYLALVKGATPKAGKVKFKDNLRDIINLAVANAQTTAARIIELIDKDDTNGIREIGEEMIPEEKVAVMRQLNPEQQDHLRQIMK